MSEITAIEQQVKDKSRCSIYIDGKFYCGIKIEIAVKYRLKAGMHIEKAELDEIQFETEKSQALDKAMTHLSATMKTEKQMSDFLSKKGYTGLVIEYVLERLKYYGFIDDYAYCKAYVAGVHGKGRRAIEADLIRRGAKREAVAAALSEFEEDDNEAYELVSKYMRGKANDKKTYFKAYKYLLSKGYDMSTAKSALSKLGGDDEDY